MKRILLLFSLAFLGWSTGYGQYCTTGLYSSGCTVGDDIHDFSFGSFSQTATGCPSGAAGFSDYTSDTITVTQTLDYTVAATSNFSSQTMKIWIDFNDDQDFDDPGEEIYNSTPTTFGGGTPLTDVVNIGTNITSGVHRMRVRVVYFSTTFGPCDNQSFGEVHDYTINVQPNTTGNCPSFTNVSVDSISGSEVKVSWTPGSGNADYYLEYGATGFTPGTGTMLTGTYPISFPVVLTGLSPLTGYDIYLCETCNSSADSVCLNLPLNFTTTKLCLSPTNFAASNPTTNSVDLSWNHVGASQEQWIIWGNQGFDPSTGGNIDTVTGTTHTVTGLTPTTSYDFYVVANCGGGNGVSDTIGPANAATLIVGPSGVNCPSNNPVTLINEDFEGPTGWGGISGNSGDWGFNSGPTGSGGTGPTGAYSGNSYVYFEASGAGPALMTSPIIDLTSATDGAELSFWMHAYGADIGYLIIRASTASATGPFSDTIFYYNQGQLQTADSDPWQQVGVNLDAYLGQTLWLEFEADRNGSFTSDFSLDSLIVETCGDICVPPSALSASNVTADSADLGWIENSGATNWDIEWGTLGFTPTGTPTNAGVTSVPYRIGGLQPNSNYEFYVRSNCGPPSGTSAWAGPFTFSTPLQGPLGVNCPSNNPVTLFTEEFDNQSAGWTGDISTSSGDWQYESGPTGSFGTGPSGAHSGSNYIYFEASGAGPASLISPSIDLTAATDSAEMGFWMHAYGSDIGYLLISVSTTSATGPFNDTVFYYNQGQLQSSEAEAWTNVGVRLDQFVGQNIWVKFEADRDGGLAGDLALDLVTIETCGDICVPPSSLAAGNFIADSAYLSWTENSGATNWDIEFGPAGFTPTGTPTNAGVTSNPFGVGGLSANTSYEFYVRSNCGGVAGQSGWAGPFTFSTPLAGPQGVSCPGNDNAIILSEEFNNNNSGVWTGDIGTFSGQWQFETGPTGSSATGPDGPYSGGSYIYFEASGSGPASLISPAINLVPATDEAELSFYLHAYGAHVGYLVVRASTAGPTGPFNDTLFLYNSGQLQTSSSDPWQPVGVSLDNYLGQTVWLEFQADRTTSFSGDISLDLLKIETCGSYCLPEIFSLDSIVANSAYDASVYVDTSGDNFQLEWGPCGYTQGTGTFQSGASPFNLTNLSPSTCYDVYVRRNCGAGNGFSGWAGPFSFGTPCISFCDYDVDLYDTFGDGWNGAELSFYQNGSITATVGENFTGGNDQLNIATQLCDSSTTYVVLTDAGSFPGEIGFDVTSPYPDLIASYPAGSGSPSTGDTLAVFQASCVIATCPDPYGLTATNVTDSTADLSWRPGTAGNIDFEISFGMDLTDPAFGTSYIVTDSSLAVTNLMESSQYCYYVREICAAGDTSRWIGPFCFATPCPITCNYTADLYDTFGDGWNGALLSFIQNGSVVQTIGSSFATGDSVIGVSVTLCDSAMTYVVVEDAGSFPGEVYFRINTSYGVEEYFHPAGNFPQGDTLVSFFTSCAPPTCPAPTNISTSNATMSSVDVSWTSGGATDWWLEYGPTGFTPGTGTLVTTTNNPYNITGLSAGTMYDVYVRDSCAVGDVSFWTGPVSFTTLCNLQPITLPHTEGFERFSQTFYGSALVCDSTQVNIEFTSADPSGRLRFNAGAGYTFNGTSAATLDREPSGNDVVNYLDLTYDMSNYASTSGINLDFHYMHHGEENSPNDSVWIRGSSSDPWIGIYDLHANQGAAGAYNTVQAIPIGMILSNNGQAFSSSFGIRFGQEDNFPAATTTGSDGYTFDDITLYTVTCPAPSNITTANTTTSSVDVGWTTGGATNWQLEYGPIGFTPGTGTMVNTTSNPYTITGLAPGTYQVYVRDSCGASDISIWTGPATFSINPCTAAQTCTFTVNLYDTFGDGWNGGLISFVQGGVVIQTFGASFTSGDSITGLTVDLCDGLATDVILSDPGGFPGEMEFTVESPTATVVVNHTAATGLALGDTLGTFQASCGLSCPAPTSFSASNVTGTSADLSWTTGGATDWQIQFGPTGFTPGTGTFLSVNTNPYTLGGLTASTSYDVYVRDSCGQGDVSTWTGPLSFTTMGNTVCQPVSNLAMSSVGCDSIVITWSSTSQQSIVEYGPAGFTPGQGTMTSIVTSPFTLSGLAPGSAYDFWVADVCPNDTSSFGAAPLMATTSTGPMPNASIAMLGDSVSGGIHYYIFDATGSTDATSYSWDFGNGSTTNGSQVLGSYSNAGTYTVVLTATNSCGTHMDTMLVEAFTVVENDLGKSLSVYPNPTQSDITIEFDPQGSSDATVRITDMRGREIRRRDFHNINGRFRQEVSLADLAKGVYMIEIHSGDMRAYRRVNLQ